MERSIHLYNSLTRKKEEFIPLHKGKVGMYVCGPTVYSEPHLGHARMAISFDIAFRLLQFAGYKVRYVRNVTDVGHLEDELADSGEDKIAKKAKLEQLEPMEVVQHYYNAYRDSMHQLNVLDPSIEPHASGHIIEQQQMIEQILEHGFAYEVNGSVYFDTKKYDEAYSYGVLSGRKIEDLLENTRNLAGSSDKRSALDFALWKKASPEHLMQWPSKWGQGFPGWHLECSAMGTKYLGETFDLHGGGLDLLFPHHECEIAQSVAANGKSHVRYWMHNNMITIGGQKMARSLNNFITLDQMFSGRHELLEQAYDPMTVRFFMLQAHYRSTLDFSNEALQASEKGLKRLLSAYEALGNLTAGSSTSNTFDGIMEKCMDALYDDFNTPIAIAHLFDGVKLINSIKDGSESITSNDLAKVKEFYKSVTENILGLKANIACNSAGDASAKAIDLLLNIRLEAKKNKDFATSDRIRNELTQMGIVVKDTKDGVEWSYA